jgi:hypothetical protein
VTGARTDEAREVWSWRYEDARPALEDVLVTKPMARPEHRCDMSVFVLLEGLGVPLEAKQTTGGHATRGCVLTPRGSAAAHVG